MASNSQCVCPHVQDEGFTELYTPPESVETIADIIFVHGLRGHPRKTWQLEKSQETTDERSGSKWFWKKKKDGKDGKPKQDQPGSENRCYWPFDLLPLDVKNVRVLTYGYDSSPTHWVKAANRMTISQHATNLLAATVSRRAGHDSRPIIFVAHSLGGIVVEDAIIESRKYLQNPRMRQVYDHCRAIVFFGTPHLGSEFAEWGRLFTNIVSAVTPVSTYKELLRALSPDSEKLGLVTKDFNDVLNADVPREKRLKICSVREGKGFSGINGFDGKVVPDSSAVFGRRDIEIEFFIQQNHMNMCRFTSKADTGYEIFLATLLYYLQDIQNSESLAQTTDREVERQTQEAARVALVDSLDFSGRLVRENQLWNIQANPATFEWIWSSPFAEWLFAGDGLFWICGKPGSGKSTLMHHLFQNREVSRQLRQGVDADWIVLHHFFDFRAHRGGEPVRNTFEGFLKSLLIQLSEAKVDLDEIDNLPRQGFSPMSPGQNWLVGNLQQTLKRVLADSTKPICIFLDGLDEYAGQLWDLAEFLQGIAGPRTKLCLASRPDEILLTALAQVPSFRMQDLNHTGIQKYVDVTLRQSLAKSGFFEDEAFMDLAASITYRAEGVFVWAYFATNKLRDGWTRYDDMLSLYKKLDQIPADLYTIYSRIFEKIQPNDRRTTGHMLQLVFFARRTLSLEELWAATERAEKREVSALSRAQLSRFEQRVVATTGGILECFWDLYSHNDSEYKIRLVNVIHRTVQSFLDEKGWSQILESPTEVELESEILWLHVCSQELCSKSGAFIDPFVRAPFDRKRFRSRLDHEISLNASVSDPDCQIYLSQDSNLLQQYAAMFMLDHAKSLEDRGSVSSYGAMQPSIKDRFLHLHRYYSRTLRNSCKGCKPSLEMPELVHPLHLIIEHGLALYTFDYLAVNGDTPLPVSWTSSRRAKSKDVKGKSTARDTKIELCKIPVGLLEFTVHQTCKPLNPIDITILETILKYRPIADDVAIVTALNKSDRPEVVQLLLEHRPPGPMILAPRDLQYSDAFEGQPDGLELYLCNRRHVHTHNYPHLLASHPNVGPLWVVARRKNCRSLDVVAAIIDLLISRGEDINSICGPFGTALHASLTTLNERDYVRGMAKVLLDKGADVSASGPLGTPLEFAWLLATTSVVNKAYWMHNCLKGVELLLRYGGVNNRPDPDGKVPNREQMMDFCRVHKDGYHKARKLDFGLTARRTRMNPHGQISCTPEVRIHPPRRTQIHHDYL